MDFVSIDMAELINAYGLPLIFMIAFASCLALPVPASLAFMIAGTFAAGGQLPLAQTFIFGLAGAIAGDQSGYLIAKSLLGHSGNNTGKARFGEKWKKGIEQARRFQQRWGKWSIFLSRWLASPLGPWVNFSSGITGYDWRIFTLWASLGEIVWVGIYVGLGYTFGGRVQAIADLIGNAIWLIVTLAIALAIGVKLFRPKHQ
jgi:membrane protein DedA with SNARE-associated domain